MALSSFFWTPQNDLLISPDNSGRDPLGLQPIWSGAGRMIVPHLASGISRYEGLLAVLLGYEIASRLSLNSTTTRQFFYTWEALVETQWHINLERDVLFGTRFFANGLDTEPLLPKNPKNALTYRKGLWLFYRGTLRRTGLLTQDLKLNQNNKIIWPKNALSELDSFFEKHFKKKENISLKEAATKLADTLEKCWKHRIALKCLMDNLFEGDSNKLCNQWALECDKNEIMGNTFSWNEHVEGLLSSTESEYSLHRRLKLLNRIDPWLAVLESVANWLDGQDQCNSAELVSQLTNFGVQKNANEAAMAFPKISDIEAEIDTDKIGNISSTMRERWEILSKLAIHFESKQWLAFIAETVAYHHKITSAEKRRWRLEPNLLLCNLTRHNSPLPLDLEKSPLKYQSYYLHTARQLYIQLKGALT
jgi:hypothetical protein